MGGEGGFLIVGGFLTPTLSPFYTGRAGFDSIKSQIFHAGLS